LVAAVAVAGCGVASFPAPLEPGDPTRADEALDEAVALVAKLEYANAEARLERLAETLDASGRRAQAAEARFWLGYCLEKRNRAAEAAAAYRHVVERYPETPAARQAAERLTLIRSSAALRRAPPRDAAAFGDCRGASPRKALSGFDLEVFLG
jgi:hypothetical protein